MGKARYGIYAVLALIALAGLFQSWLGSGSAGAIQVDLPVIVRSPEGYHGREVITQGVIREFTGSSGRHYVLEAHADPGVARVLISGPDAARLVNHAVSVTGTITFTPELGIALEPRILRDLGPIDQP